jgi:predicted transcriptional regulator YdeE
MAVGIEARSPIGWVIREVPAAQYAVFETTLADVGDATEYALDEWLPDSNYKYDGVKPRFDLMPPDTTGQESPVSVWIPVRRREE